MKAFAAQQGIRIGAAFLLLNASIAVKAAEEILDRTVAVVGDRAITLSEVEDQLALEALDREGHALVGQEQRLAVIERLVRLRLVQREMRLAGFVGATEEEVQHQWEERSRDYGGEEAFRKAIADRGLTEVTVRDFLRQQLSFAHFVDFLFRTGLVVPREEVESYYEKEYKPKLPASVEPPPLERVYAQLEDDLMERRIDPLLEDWINRVRSETRITIIAPPQTPDKGAAP